MKDRIRSIANFIRSKTSLVPEFGLILGTGLSGIESEFKADLRIAYRDIPGFPVSTVESHKGELIIGLQNGVPVACFAGRFHYYEGYDMKELTLPVRVLRELGTTKMILTNAAGGTNPEFEAGDIVFMTDHINMMPDNPLRGPNDESLGPRFPDMSEVYDKRMIGVGKRIAREMGIPVRQGVYVALPGPNLETPAEYRFMHRIGADLVGMSTVPEAIVAKHAGMSVLALSVVTNVCYPPEAVKEVSVEDVISTAKKAGPGMVAIVRGVIEQCRD